MPDIKKSWYFSLIEDCNAIITEGVFASRWILIETYHNLGKRILQETDNFDRAKIYGKEITKNIADSLGKSQRTIQYAISFAKKYPELDQLPEGKNISWTKIVHNYLPEKTRDTQKRDKKTDLDYMREDLEDVGIVDNMRIAKHLIARGWRKHGTKDGGSED